MPKHIEIMDTTLRDGEQTSGVSYSPKEKLTIAKLLLDDLKIDRIEVASARVSEGELNSVKEISSWAESNSRINSIEVLTFIDEGKSIPTLPEYPVDIDSYVESKSYEYAADITLSDIAKFQRGSSL